MMLRKISVLLLLILPAQNLFCLMAVADVDNLDPNAKLKAAREWAENIGRQPFTGTPVVSVEFIREKLRKDQNNMESKSVWRNTIKPFLVAKALKSAMDRALTQTSGATEVSTVQNAWLEEQRQLLKDIVDEDKISDADAAGAAYAVFLNAWRAKVLEEDMTRLRDAMRQLPVIVIGVFLKLDDKHIADVARGTIGDRGTRTTTVSRTSGTSIAAVRHARIMSRINRRNTRRGYRIERIRAR